MSTKITVVGSLNMDLVVRSPRIPQPGETLLGQGFVTLPGGKGANQAVAAARLGGDVTMIGRLGADGFATALRAGLDEDGVDHRHVLATPDVATGVALITVDDEGRNTIVVASGANWLLTPADVDRAEDAISTCDVLLLQLEVPLETVRRAAQVARSHDVRVILNPAPAQPLPAELLALVDILIPNESETALLTGLPVEDEPQARSAAARLLERGVGAVILTLGSRGALLTTQAESRLFPAFALQPVDTTAAGDAFVGGLAVALGEGRPLDEAVVWGNAAGGLSTTVLGAQPSLPRRADVERRIQTNLPAAQHSQPERMSHEEDRSAESTPVRSDRGDGTHG